MRTESPLGHPVMNEVLIYDSLKKKKKKNHPSHAGDAEW